MGKPITAVQVSKPAPIAKVDPVEQFSAAVRAIAGANPTWHERQAAIRKVARDQPRVYAEYRAI